MEIYFIRRLRRPEKFHSPCKCRIFVPSGQKLCAQSRLISFAGKAPAFLAGPLLPGAGCLIPAPGCRLKGAPPLLCHGHKLVMAELHRAEANKNAVGFRALPDLGAPKRAEADRIQMRLHVQQQTTAGGKIDQQNMVIQRLDSLYVLTLLQRFSAL